MWPQDKWCKYTVRRSGKSYTPHVSMTLVVAKVISFQLSSQGGP